MFWIKIGRALISRPVFMGGGAAAVALATLLTWGDLFAQLNSRHPVPSPDGKYFAYFDSIELPRLIPQAPNQLIISTVRGQEVARFVMIAGNISWSNAGDLAVINPVYHYAALIADSDGRFLPVKYLRYARAAPLWSTDGTKMAYVRRELGVEQLAVYDFLQTRETSVPLPHLEEPLPLFWSPGGGLLFFLNGAGTAVVLDQVDIQSGRLQHLATGSQSWRRSSFEGPRMSPDGAKIYLPPTFHSVIDAQTGQTVWKLPPLSKVSRTLWSADGHQIYYLRGDDSGAIVAHDLTDSTDRLVLNHTKPGGFFSADGERYFYRADLVWPPCGAWQAVHDWLKLQWGWQQLDVAARSIRPLGRVLLQPEEQTRDGLISMSRDDYVRVHYGLYEPQSRKFSKFVFPTDWEDITRSARWEGITLFGAVLYGTLAIYMLMMLPPSSRSRAIYTLSMILMVLFASLNAKYFVFNFSHWAKWDLGAAIMTARSMTVTSFRFAIFQIQLVCLIAALAVLPVSFLHLVLVFPGENQFLEGRKKLKLFIYALACVPIVDTICAFLWAFGISEGTTSLQILPWAYYTAGSVILLTTFFAFVYHFSHLPAQPAPIQFRRAMIAMVVPLAALAGRELLHIF